MISRLLHAVLGFVAFVGVWVSGALLIGFGLGVAEMIVLTLLATGAFVLVKSRLARECASSF
jgi:hypothetical protein